MLAFSMTVPAQSKTLSGLYPENFRDTIDGKPTALYVLKNENGMEACVTNYGARLVSLMTPNWNGRMEDVVLGYDNIKDYYTRGQNFGATVGRYVGRIIGPEFSIDGHSYRLQDDGKGHIAHGGKPGFQNRVWDVMQADRQKIVLQYVSPDGENGFPGELTVTLTYTLTDRNWVDVDFKAETTKPTVLNLTNHCYFNLSGDPSKDCLDETLVLDADSITAVDENVAVTGEVLAVAGTPFDFKTEKVIGKDIDDTTNTQIKNGIGYDHNWILNTKGDIKKCFGTLYDPNSGIQMQMYTDQPGVQFYAGNFLDGTFVGKNGVKYPRRSAFCFETQHYPDSPNHPEWPSTTLLPGDKYETTTIYKFDIK